MAKKSKTEVPDDVKTELEEQKVADAVVVDTEPVVEQPTEPVANETAPAPEKGNSFVDSLKSFGGKTKTFFVNTGKKTKNFFVNLFKKGKNAEPTDEQGKDEQVESVAVQPVEAKVAVADASAEKQPADLAPVGEAAVAKPALLESNLSFREKMSRFFHSQSGWLFVLPALILLAIFTFWPIISAFINAFKQNYNALNNTYDGWGFENFVRVLKGDTGTGGATFVQCLINTMIFTFISVPLSTLLALLISVALNSIKALQKAYQTILFLPYLTNALAMGAVFATFFTIVGTKNNTETIGLVNNFLGIFGIEPINWVGVGSPTWQIGSISIPWAKYIVVIVYEVWAGLPFKILILFSSLQSVNKQYYDAAKIDGASKNTVLWKITAPMIGPMISYLLVTGIMGGMKQYSSIVGLFGEQMGRDYDVGTMVGYIYQYIESGKTGYAFAGSLLLFAIIMLITLLNNYVSKKRVTY